MRDDESPYSSKQASLLSKLVSSMCCREDVCSCCPSGGAVNECCSDCWTTARRRRDSTKLGKQEIEYVIDKQCGSGLGRSGSGEASGSGTAVASGGSLRRCSRKSTSSSTGGGSATGVEDGGYDNEACTVMLEREHRHRPTPAPAESPAATAASASVPVSPPPPATPAPTNGNVGSAASVNGHHGITGGTVKDIKNELYHRIEMRRSNSISTTPVIDWKAIQFWTANACSKVEGVQPRLHPGRRSMSVQQPDPIGNHLYQQSLHQQQQLLQQQQQPSPLDHGFKPQLYQQETALGSPDSDTRGRADGVGAGDDEEPPPPELGRLHFSVQYEIPTRLLLVKVIEARELARPLCLDDTRQDMAHSNPYVRVCLLPDQKNAHQTSVKRKTQAPSFDETFAFELSYREVQMRTLQLKVKDFDKYSRHCVLGQVLLPLDDVNLVKGRHMWKPLVPCEKEQHDLGDLMISLNYLPSAGRLNVDVIKAKQLLQTDISGGSFPFVRISLVLGGKLWKSKKTSCKKNTIDPVFNESFSFHVSTVELSSVTAVLTAWDHNSGLGKDHFIGRVVLGKMASGPDEITHWERMLRAHRSPIAQWHSLRSRQECDELSPASLLVP